LKVEGSGVNYRIALEGDDTYDAIRDVAADLKAGITRLELARHKLEELFADK
jgi:hypothetical protein